MSRPTFRHRAGLILTLVAFVLGATAATALGWENETTPGKGRDYGKNEGKDYGKNEGKGHGKNEGKGHGKNEGKGHGKNEGKGHGGKKPEKPPTVTVPTPTPPTPPGLAPPPTTATPSPVVQLGTTTPTSPGVNAKGSPGGVNVLGEQEQGGSDVAAEVAPGTASPTLAPAAEREQLAATGLDPALMGLIGLLCLGGGALLFRRALARQR